MNQLDELFQKRMDRKEFLKNVGLGLALLVGFGTFTKLLRPNVAAKTGYGSAAYGGPTKPKN